jgi:hypothetical protein
MNYYGIVGKHGFEYGIYGRSMSQYENLGDPNRFLKSIEITSNFTIPFKQPEGILYDLAKGYVWLTDKLLINNQLTTWYTKKIIRDKIELTFKLVDTPQFNLIIIPNVLLANDYQINEEPLLFSFFKNSMQFKKAMKADGGNSNIIIIERDNLPKNFKHFAGDKGIFDYGLYTEHPKDKNILMPLSGRKEKIESAILEETIRLYQALGAKEILIEDITDTGIKNDTNIFGRAKIGTKTKINKEILRLEKYEKGYFNPEEALKNTYFIQDYEEITSLANGRITHNQTSKEFTETININVGLNVNILELFSNDTKVEYKRKWHFKVDFYDKNIL